MLNCGQWAQWKVQLPDKSWTLQCNQHKEVLQAKFPEYKFQFVGAVPAGIDIYGN